MAGNVWEWTRSVYKDYPYNPEDGREDPRAEDRRVVRGGSFDYNRGGVRCASRGRSSPYYFGWGTGFRVVASPAHSLDSETSGAPVKPNNEK